MKQTTKMALAVASLPFVWWGLMMVPVSLGVSGHPLTLTAIATLWGMFYAAAAIGHRAGQIEAAGK